jgi:uncharacterized protein YutD
MNRLNMNYNFFLVKKEIKICWWCNSMKVKYFDILSCFDYINKIFEDLIHNLRCSYDVDDA